jgi:hypothetical protein
VVWGLREPNAVAEAWGKASSLCVGVKASLTKAGHETP